MPSVLNKVSSQPPYPLAGLPRKDRSNGRKLPSRQGIGLYTSLSLFLMKNDIKTGSVTVLGPVTQGNKKLAGGVKKKKAENMGHLEWIQSTRVLEPIEQACQRAWADLTVLMLPHTAESLLQSGAFLSNNEGEMHGRCSHWSGKRGFMHTPQTDILSSKQTRLQPYMSAPSPHPLDLPISQSAPVSITVSSTLHYIQPPTLRKGTAFLFPSFFWLCPCQNCQPQTFF